MSEENKEDKTPGKFCWHELMTNDVEGTKKFYGGMFGWTFEDMDMGEMIYTMFKNGEEHIGGMMAITPEMEEMGVKPHLMDYITVEDIDAAVEKAKGLGASICKDVTELPMGKFAVITDPAGICFSFWEFSCGEGGGDCESND